MSAVPGLLAVLTLMVGLREVRRAAPAANRPLLGSFRAMPDADSKVTLARKLGFGAADVVVAVPDFWIDVTTMADLEEAAVLFRRRHGMRMRVATKYLSLIHI